MRWPCIAGTLALLAGLSCFAQKGSEAPTQTGIPPAGYSITVSAPPSPISLGSPIEITITVKNIAGRDIPWRAEVGATAYKAFRVSLAKGGHEPETTPFHRRLTGNQRPDDPLELGPSSSIVSSIAPGESFTQTMDIKRLYNITEPGLYTLQVSRYDEATKTTVRSNTVTLNILPKQKE